MEEKACFSTQTDERYALRQELRSFGLVFLIFSAVACLGFLVSWKTFLFFEALVVFATLSGLLQKRKKLNWLLEFEQTTLTLTNLETAESITIRDLPADAFLIGQGKQEEALDYCSLLIKNTAFGLTGVQNCKALQAYIEAQFQP